MKKAFVVIFLTVGVAAAVFPQQDAANRLLKVLDEVISAAESGRGSPVPDHDQSRVSFSLFNHTGFTVKNVFVCGADSSEWGPSIIVVPLYHGMSIVVSLDLLPSGENACNIRMVDVDGDSYTKYGVKIGDSSVVKITINDFEFD